MKDLLQKQRERHEDFYWERGEFSDRPLGFTAHSDFFAQSQTELIEAVIEMVEECEHMGDVEKRFKQLKKLL